MRYILIGVIYLSLVTLVPRQLIQVEKLPACKTGWKLDTAPFYFPGYIPTQYLYRVMSGAPRSMIIKVVAPDGRILARVRRGESVAFDCFDDTTQCGPGDRCV